MEVIVVVNNASININVRRTAWSYLMYVPIILFCLHKLFITQTSWGYLWFFYLVGSVLILVRLIVKPYYFEVKGAQLIINHDLFSKDTIEISNIEKIVLEEGPFSKSRILLKDGKKGPDFNYFIVNNKDLYKFKESLQLNVE